MLLKGISVHRVFEVRVVKIRCSDLKALSVLNKKKFMKMMSKWRNSKRVGVFEIDQEAGVVGRREGLKKISLSTIRRLVNGDKSKIRTLCGFVLIEHLVHCVSTSPDSGHIVEAKVGIGWSLDFGYVRRWT